MTGNAIEHYETFSTKGCPDELVFVYFQNQPIPSDYYNFLNDDDEDDNNITGITVDDVLLEK